MGSHSSGRYNHICTTLITVPSSQVPIHTWVKWGIEVQALPKDLSLSHKVEGLCGRQRVTSRIQVQHLLSYKAYGPLFRLQKWIEFTAYYNNTKINRWYFPEFGLIPTDVLVKLKIENDLTVPNDVIKTMVPLGVWTGTFRVWGEDDRHYTAEPATVQEWYSRKLQKAVSVCHNK